MLKKGDHQRRGADPCSSNFVLDFVGGFLSSLMTRAGASQSSQRSAPDLAVKEKNNVPKQIRIMLNGATNEGGGNCAAERKKQTKMEN